ncbi:MAG: hypothetical protein ACJ8DC_15065 [Gemmatimonadales bacterium]
MSSHPLPGALFVLLAGLVAGCTSERPADHASSAPAVAPAATPATAPAGPAQVTITATDFKLDLPAQIPAGVVSLHLVNRGKELHQAQVVRLEEGKTLDDFAKAMKQNGPPPSWVKFIGGPNGVAPDQDANSTMELAPGHYAVLCYIPGADGVPHVMKGMVQPFEVTAGAGAAADQLPAADVTVKMADYSFEASQPLTPGHHTILVENVGPQQHEIVLLKLSPGKSVRDFGKWAVEGMKGPPPGMPLGGLGAMEKDARGVFVVDLAPGDYGFICFVPDVKDQKPHLAHGMVKQFKVG